jgi:hypothetical protein
VTSTVQDEVSDVLATLKGNLKVRGQAVLKDIAGGRPIVPAVLSGVTLAFTEARDFFSWREASTATPAAPEGSSPTTTPPEATAPPPDTTTATPPDVTAATPPAPTGQTTTATQDTLTQIYDYLHHLSASVPNEWVFRLRIGAFALIAYAIYRLWQRRQAAAKAK